MVMGSAECICTNPSECPRNNWIMHVLRAVYRELAAGSPLNNQIGFLFTWLKLSRYQLTQSEGAREGCLSWSFDQETREIVCFRNNGNILSLSLMKRCHLCVPEWLVSVAFESETVQRLSIVYANLAVSSSLKWRVSARVQASGVLVWPDPIRNDCVYYLRSNGQHRTQMRFRKLTYDNGVTILTCIRTLSTVNER